MKQELISIEYYLTNILCGYGNNARKHPSRQIDKLAKSIESFGCINPLIIDRNRVIIAGHARLQALKQLGYTEAPCILVDHLSEEQIRAYRLADNRIAEDASWDMGLVKVELEALTKVDLDFSPDLTGFEPPEIDLILQNGTETEPDPPCPNPPDTDSSLVQPGDIWQLGEHRLACGDCRDALLLEQLMQNARATMAFLDAPYNVPINGHARGKGRHQHEDFVQAVGEMDFDQFVNFLTDTLGALTQACVEGSVFFVCMDFRHLHELLVAGKQVFDELLNLCVWAKTNGGMGALYRSRHELILVFKYGTAPHINNVQLGKHGRNRTNVWEMAGASSFGSDREEALSLHPTVKPVQLITDAILDVTHRGDAVLDGFCGSGSTLLACERTGRVGYGVEIDPRYCAVTLQRWLDHTGIEPVNTATGKTWSETKAEVSHE